jgi:membrane protein insertase Oxa1/YidC/SpoIIIJ
MEVLPIYYLQNLSELTLAALILLLLWDKYLYGHNQIFTLVAQVLILVTMFFAQEMLSGGRAPAPL